MASKFMRIKKVVIPLITLVILVSQISGCAIMNRDDAVGIMEENSEEIYVKEASMLVYGDSKW